MNLAVESTFLANRRVVDQTGFEGHGNEIRVDAADDLGLGENRLTGGTGEHSASGVVGGPVDEDPQQYRLAGRTRLLQSLEQTGLPGNPTPGDADNLQGIDLGLEGFRRLPPRDG
jgi:hypothetical protein